LFFDAGKSTKGIDANRGGIPDELEARCFPGANLGMIDRQKAAAKA